MLLPACVPSAPRGPPLSPPAHTSSSLPHPQVSYRLPLELKQAGSEALRAALMGRLRAERERELSAARARWLEDHPLPDDPIEAADMEAARAEAERAEEEARGPIPPPQFTVRALAARAGGFDAAIEMVSGGESGLWHFPLAATPEPLREGGPANCWLAESLSGKYRLAARVDGAVQLAPDLAGAVWEGTYHAPLMSGGGGALTARLSFDDAYVLSASTDGTFFVLAVAEACPARRPTAHTHTQGPGSLLRCPHLTPARTCLAG